MGNAIAWPQPAPLGPVNGKEVAEGCSRWPLVSALGLDPLPTAVSCARLHVRNVLAEWGLPRGMVADAEVCVSETITNALEATLSLGEPLPIGLRLLANRVRLVTEAWDCHPDEPVRQPVAAFEEGGRGLALIEAYSNQWGVRRLSQHVKTVWCELLFPR
jgi:anti-sigma regulatory factor (Ser/Thr protein kinase)